MRPNIPWRARRDLDGNTLASVFDFNVKAEQRQFKVICIRYGSLDGEHKRLCFIPEIRRGCELNDPPGETEDNAKRLQKIGLSEAEALVISEKIWHETMSDEEYELCMPDDADDLYS